MLLFPVSVPFYGAATSWSALVSKSLVPSGVRAADWRE